MFPGVVYYMLDFIMPVMTDACWKGRVIYTNCYHRNLNLLTIIEKQWAVFPLLAVISTEIQQPLLLKLKLCPSISGG